MRRPEARIVEGALSTTYEIEGRSNIPHDLSGSGKTHKVAIAVVDLVANLEWITIPQQKASAFLRVRKEHYIRNVAERMIEVSSQEYIALSLHGGTSKRFHG